jgi:hypothetical protein
MSSVLRAVIVVALLGPGSVASARALPAARTLRKAAANSSSWRSSRIGRLVSPGSRAGRTGSGSLGRSAPLLDAAVRPADVVPPSILKLPAMDRHLWFFKVARALRGADPARVRSYTTRGSTLDFGELKSGLEALGIQDWKAALLSMGVLIDRGGRQLLKGEGRPFKIDISGEHAWSTAHPDGARSGVYDADWKVNPAKEEAFLALLDPAGTNRITMDDFKAAAKQITGETSARGWQKRLNAGTFERAWKSFMTIAGHVDAASGTRYVTRDDVRWFHDGTYFFRLAQARAARSPASL